MDRLILFRHGEAQRNSASGRDFDRRLKTAGAGEAAQTGRRLADLGVAAGLALVSPAARARETWEEAKAALPSIATQEAPRLYNAEADAVRAIVEAEAETDGAVIVVGHNPGLHELAVALMEAAGAPLGAVDQVSRGFPTGAAAVFRIDQGRPVFEALILPGEAA